MNTKIIEVSNRVNGNLFNYGKFLVGMMDEEWQRQALAVETGLGESTPRAIMGGGPLLHQCGWSREFLWVLDLQTGEGVFVKPTGNAAADLTKHAIWVCLLYEPFLVWLYGQYRTWKDIAVIVEQSLQPTLLDFLPETLELTDAPAGIHGYRRPGPDRATHPAFKALKARRRNNKGRIRPDNATLPAGFPMYFGCVSCNETIEVPEDYLPPRRKLCGQCQDLQDIGWL